jgi:hypothetical protein
MTLGVAWMRNIRDVQELVVASDSRLSNGPETWHGAPKIIALPRTDAVISFAGVTELAYPVMLQVARAVESNPAHIERRLDLTILSGLVCDVINQIDSMATTDSKDSLMQSRRGTTFMLSGYSWRYSEFRIWLYGWDGGVKRFTRRRAEENRGGFAKTQRFRFIGDETGVARQRLKQLLSSSTNSERLDMEPLTVLLEMIRDERYRSIGGAPQLVKIYRHMNSQVFSMMWPDGSRGAKPTYAGRTLLGYEQTDAPTLDPDQPTFE